MNVLDSITKTPSQVLVKSATNFGQDAAKIIGAYAEECIKNSTDDVLHEIREATEKLSESLQESLSGFADTFHKTGVEAFTEWGIGIERAFLHLGQKLETGLTNSTNRVAYTLRDSLDETLWRIRRTVHSSSGTFSDALAQFGLKHAEVYKHVFRHEIMILLACSLLVSFSLCIFALSAASKMGLTASVFDFVSLHFVPLCFLTFALLNAYVIFAATSAHREKLRAASSPLRTPLSAGAPDNAFSHSATGALSASQDSNNSLVVYAIVASIGYMAGNLSTQIFTFSSLNFLISFSIMICVTLLAYKVLAFNILYRIYAFYQHIQEFRIYLKEKKRNELLEDELLETTSAEPQSAMSNDSTADFWSDEEDALKQYRLRRRRKNQQASGRKAWGATSGKDSPAEDGGYMSAVDEEVKSSGGGVEGESSKDK